MREKKSKWPIEDFVKFDENLYDIELKKTALNTQVTEFVSIDFSHFSKWKCLIGALVRILKWINLIRNE